MGLFDEIDREVLNQNTSDNNVQNTENNTSTGLFAEIDREVEEEFRPKSFAEKHPVVASIPEATKQFGSRAVKSYPEYAAGLNDLLANVGDKVGAKKLSDFGRSNYEFWKEQSGKIPVNQKYQGVAGLLNPSTILPTITGSVGDQATNIINAVGGGAIGAKAAAKLGLGGLAKTGLVTVGTSIPNLAQEGTYLDKIEAFQKINGRTPTVDEMKQIQNVAFAEKATNTALETIADKLLFGKVFPQGTTTKSVKNFLKNIGQQSLTEAGTEAMQEGVSIGAEKVLGINQGDNLQRIADSAAIGGVTGGAMGGVASLATRPYETQFAEPIAETSVSAKVLNNGKVLYDNTVNALNNVAENLNKNGFDKLRTLSKEGSFSNKVEQLAPKTAAKQTANNQKNTQNNFTENDQADINLLKFIKDEDGNVYEVNDGIARNVDADETTTLDNLNNYEKYKVNPNEYISQTEFTYNPDKTIPENAQDFVMSQKDVVDAYNNYIDSPTLENKEKYQDVYGQTIENYINSFSAEKQAEKTNKNTKRNQEVQKNDLSQSRTLNENGTESANIPQDNKTLNTETKNEVSQKNDNKIKKNNKLRPRKNDSVYESKSFYTDGVFLVKKSNFEMSDKNFKTSKTALTDEQVQKVWNEHTKNNPISELKPTGNVWKGQKVKAVEYEFTSKKGTVEKLYLDKKQADIFKGYDLSVSEINTGDGIALSIVAKDNGNPVGIVMPLPETAAKHYQANPEKFINKQEEKNKKQVKKEIQKLKIEQLAPKTVAKQTANNNLATLEKDSEIVNNYEKGVENEQRRSEISEEIGRTSEEVESSENNRRSDDDNGRSGQRDFDGRRIKSEHQDLIEKKYKNQHEKNKAIEKFINDKEYEKYSELPEEIKSWLKQYAGAGGLEKQGAEGKGLLTEYYTPEDIVKKMWELTSQYVNTDGSKVLEPSVGIGRFLEFAPENTTFDAVEMNPVSAKITELLYPNANVTVGEFQKKFVKNNKPVKKVAQEYDIVIGNPPYGSYEGIYKGLGEGKGHLRLESYFIDRALDTLKENGVLTFIVPSSFLETKASANWKQNIAKKATLLDAYRLPEKMFDTTSVGTDIIVIRKNTKNTFDTNLSNGEWFKKHPEKILGTVEQRKNRFGKLENVVKGDKNAIGQIETSKKDVKETVEKDINVPSKKNAARKSDHIAGIGKKDKKPAKTLKGNVEYTEYEIDLSNFTKAQLETFYDTQVDGTLPKTKYKPNEYVNQFRGELYNDFNYLQGDIYEKLEQLENEDITEKQKEIQRKKLEEVKPTPKTVEQIFISPVSDFARDFNTGLRVEKNYWGEGQWHEAGSKITLQDLYLKYANDLTLNERDNVAIGYIEKYVRGDRLNIDYNYPKNCRSEKDRKNFRNKESIRIKTQLVNTVDKTFKNFIKDSLPQNIRKNLIDKWNRTNNNICNPDYTKMPMIAKGLNSEFYGKKLKLLTAQSEGINFLTNKGTGLLGFEVGVGKTLTGIVATVQNMQMGRCKKPLILVPKQVIKNWVAEIKEAFPNVQINDVGNLSDFNGTIADNTITVATYQALDNIWYDDKTEVDLVNAISSASINAKKGISKRNSEKTKEQAETVLGTAKAGNKGKFTIQELGFDHVTIDEAHNFKNLFSKAQSFDDSNNIYSDIPTGSQSKRACQLFLATQYVLQHNQNRNVFLLTATPFNNNPIEVYNMLSYTAKDILDKMGINNVYQFMETYANVASDFVVDSNNNVVYKQIVNGFKNVSSLKDIIRSTMLIRTAEEAGVKRPEKTVKTIKLEPTKKQLEALAEAENIAIANAEDGDVLRAINQSRQATLSPDIANSNFDVSPEEFVNNAPKIKYCCDSIAAMLKKDSKTSQILYMPLGIRFLPKIKQYLVDKKVLKADEIKIVDSSVKDEQIEDIVDAFNNREGKLKLIIGTSKIKEGMNLNKNTSTLYVPYLDWNPTDFMQIEGRLWRQGNTYKKVRVIVPLLKNSSDSFMFQKIQEKSERLNALLSNENTDFIDMNELNTAEDKINMISAPDKKAKMYVQMEEQKIKDEKASLEGRKETVNSYKEKLSNAKNKVESAQNGIKSIQNEINKYNEIIAEKQETDPDYAKYDLYLEQAKKSLKLAKNDLNNAENKLLSLEKRIKSLELDFEGKDTEENINKLIEEKDKEIESLQELEKKKLEEFATQYEKEQKESKTIEDYVKEFEKESDDFLERDENLGFGSYNPNPFIKYVFTKLSEYAHENKSFKLKDFLNEFEIADLINTDNIPDSVTVSVTNNVKDTRYGSSLDEMNHIYLNAAQIGNDSVLFVKTIAHELEHVKQHQKYIDIKEKPKNQRTEQENQYIKDYAKCAEVNKTLTKIKKNPIVNKILLEYRDEYKKNGLSERDFINNLTDKESTLYTQYKLALKNYFNARFEKEARQAGDKAEEYARRNGRNNEINIIGRVGTVRQKFHTEGIDGRRINGVQKKVLQEISNKENSSEALTSSQKAAKTRKEKLKAAQELDSADSSAIKNAIRKWNAKIEKDRYDVNKTLNSLINISKAISKEFSKKYGFKISDKMIREVMPFLRERTDIPENLNRPELIKLFKSLTREDKARLTKLADDTSAKFEKYYKEYKTLKGDLTESNIANHISHIWKKSSKDMPLLTNYFAMQSRYAKNRTIPTIFDGINGITLENGETKFYEPETLDYAEICKISSDTFIKSNADIILADYVKSLKNEDGVSLVLPFSKAPNNWVEFDNPALSKRVYMGRNKTFTFDRQSVKVHPDIADTLKTVFETTKDNKIMQGYDKLNSIYKQLQLGFSGFHMVALTESMLGNMGMVKTLKFLNPERIFNEIKKGNWNIYADETLAKQAIDDGLQFGATLDIDRRGVEKLADSVTEWVEKTIPGVGKYLSIIPKSISSMQKLNNKFLWDYLHNNYKLECYKLLCMQEAEKRQLSTKERQEIAQWVNDSFGGLVWENLGISISGRKTEQRVFLSPDWLRSTTRQFLGIFSSGKLQNLANNKAEQIKFWRKAKELGERWGIGSLTSDVESSNMKGRIARAFWLRSIVYSAILYNVLNAVMRMKDKEENPQFYKKDSGISDYLIYSNSLPTDEPFDKFLPRVFVGRNKDGTEKMLRLGKQFREVPEMLTKPVSKLGGKLSPNIQVVSQILTGHTASGFKNSDMFEKDGKTRKNEVTSSAKVVAKSFLPYSVNQLYNKYSEPSVWSLFAPVSRGMTKSKGRKQFEKLYKNGTAEDFDKVEKVMQRNGFKKKDIKKVEKEAFVNFSKEYKEAYFNALKEGNHTEVKKIGEKLSQTSITPTQRRKIYTSAIKQYYKEKGIR